MEQQPKHSRKDYLTLFTSTFTLSAFTFGGGFVIIPLMQQKVRGAAALDRRGRSDGSDGHCTVLAGSHRSERIHLSRLPRGRVPGHWSRCWALCCRRSSFYPSFLFFTLRFGITASSRWSCGGCRPAWPPSSATWSDDGALRSGGKARPACGDAVGRVCCGALFRCERSGHYPGVRRGGRR